MFEMLMLLGFLWAGLSQMLPEGGPAGKEAAEMSAPAQRTGLGRG